MICPFYDEEARLKPASYEVALLGRYIYWDGHGIKHDDIIDSGDDFVLKANSIAFVTLEPMFRLPLYIALRFNLKITNVYQGLLLGTGPLVDPGFEGRLSIPLHNLTTNDYVLRGGEGLIWMEFTKLSKDPNSRPRRRDALGRSGRVIALPRRKRDSLDVADYLRRADPRGPIRSSIPQALDEASQASIEAAESAKTSAAHAQSTRRRLEITTAIGLVAGLVAAIALIVQIYIFVNDFNRRLDEVRSQTATSESQQINNLQSRISELERQIRDLQHRAP